MGWSQLRVRPVEVRETDKQTENIPMEKFIGGPAFGSSHSDYLLQMAQ